MKHLYDFSGWVLQAISFTCGLGNFAALTFGNAWILAQNLHFIPYAGVLVLLGLVAVAPSRKKKTGAEKDISAAQKEKAQ